LIHISRARSSVKQIDPAAPGKVTARVEAWRMAACRPRGPPRSSIPRRPAPVADEDEMQI